MSGNHPGQSGNPARRANPGLDQIAAQIRNDRQGGNPLLAPLLQLEGQMLPLFVQHAGEYVEPAQAGATMLVIGQLFNDLVSKLPAEEQHRAPALIVNLLRLLGQRLYTGDLPGQELRCPFTLPHGAPCAFRPTSSMGGTLTTVMRGHVALHHPGETWPPAEEGQADEDEQLAPAACARCGDLITPSGEDDPTHGYWVGNELLCARCVVLDRAEQLGQKDDVDEDQADAHEHRCAFDPPCVECQRRDAEAEAIGREQQQLVDLVDQHREPSNGGELQFDLPGAVDEVVNADGPDHGECPECHYLVPLARPGVVAGHRIDGTPFGCAGSGKPAAQRPYQDDGISDLLESEQPFEAKPFNRPTLSSRFEPGFDAEGNMVEFSLVEQDGRRTEIIPPGNVLRVPADQCTHPKHARMHLPGGQRCSACSSPVKPDDLPERDADVRLRPQSPDAA